MASLRRRLLGIALAGLPLGAAAQEGADAIRVLLAARLETTLSSRMAGTLLDFRARLGQRVAKGAPLAELDCSEIRAQATIAAAGLKMARLNLNAKRGLQDLDAAGELEVALAASEVQKAEGAVALSRVQTRHCRIVAPFSGRVAAVHARAHQTVAAGAPLFDLVSDGPLKVRLNVPSALLPGLKQGSALSISIHETGKTYAARVSAINARIDAVAQTVELEADLDAEHRELVPGMTGTARLGAGQ